MAGASPTIERIPPDFIHHPDALFERLRAEGPARQVVMPHGAKVWIVTRYDDVRALLNDPRISKDGRRMNEMFARHSGEVVGDSESLDAGFDDDLSMHMLNTDPPQHTRLRALVSKAFTASQMERLRSRVEQVTGDLLDAMAGQPEVDLVSAFAVPLPLIIICELFGIPERDHDDWHRWATLLVGSGHDPAAVTEASLQVTEYASALIDERRANPGDDLVSEMVRLSDTSAHLTRSELVAMIFVLVAAGLDTPMRQLGISVYTLLNHPDELAKLRADISLMPRALDELMRYAGTVATSSFRFAAADITLGEVTIPAGEMVLLALGSANRDSAHFDAPDQLDLQRRQLGNLAFGHGVHYCIGAHLARLEMEIGLAALITRYPDLRFAGDPGQLRWENGNLLRNLEALPVQVTPADRA